VIEMISTVAIGVFIYASAMSVEKGAITLGTVVAFPFFWMVLTSVTPRMQLLEWPPRFIPEPVLWGNYLQVFRDAPVLGRYFFNTVVIAIGVISGKLVINLITAYALARLHFPGRDLFFLVLLGTMMIPGQATLIPTYVLFSKLHLIDTYAVQILPGWFSVFHIFMMRQFFISLPGELEEAALLDGATRWQIMWKVILPLSIPVTATIMFFTFTGVWNSFMGPLIFTNSDDVRPIAVGLDALRRGYSSRPDLVAASAVLANIPLVLAYVLAQGRLVEGITISGLK